MSEGLLQVGLQAQTSLKHGEYRIVKTLGQGGFGITYLAEQVALNRKVAIKEFFMKDCCERDGETSYVTIPIKSNRELVEKFRGKFIKEARLLASFDHPHIVRVLDVFEENGTAYYVMENLPGGSLADRVKKEGPFSEEEAEMFIRQVAGALEYIHGRNTVHLDVKPSNILLNAKGDAVLIDFGISKHYDQAGEQTSSTPVGISKGYAPLEQGRDGDVGQFKPSTDIYALGATLYNLVTGLVPPEASIVNEEGLNRPAGLSDRIWHTIELAMKPRRKDRPQEVSAYITLLDNEGADTGNDEVTVFNTQQLSKTASKPIPKPVLAPEKTGKSKKWLWAVLAGIVVAGAILAFVFWGKKTNETPSMQQDMTENPTTNRENGHEWVDMGLSVKWATCNVGASSPSEYGNYYAWGETSTKRDYSWNTLRYCSDDSGDSFTKYNTKSAYGSVDNKMRLDLSDDAARANWGGRWRMPTHAEFDELQNNCMWTWTTQGEKNGYKVTSKKNGNSIFFPAASGRYGDSVSGAGSYGSYWSSSLNSVYPDNASYLSFHSANYNTLYSSRNHGFSVRPVTE